MNAEKYLERISKIDSLIRNRIEDHEKWVVIAEGLGGGQSDGVQASKNLHKTSDAIGRYVDIEREIYSLRQERKEIIDTIEKLPNAEYSVIYALYVSNLSVKEIAYQFHKSYEWVKKNKKNGLSLIQLLIGEKNTQEYPKIPKDTE